LIDSLANAAIFVDSSVTGFATGTEIPTASINVNESIGWLADEYFGAPVVATGSTTPSVEEVISTIIYPFGVFDIPGTDVVSLDLDGSVGIQIIVGP
jgi:hypothetical protein